jgi:hypothetical protein
MPAGENADVEGRRENSMKRLIALMLFAAIPATLVAGDGGYKVMYDGGSLLGVKAGASLKLHFNGSQIWFTKGKSDLIAIPDSAVTEISYGQDVHRRVGTAIGLGMISFGVGAFTLLAKSKKHYIGIMWKDGTNRGGVALRCSKSDYRGILLGLQGVTGKKVVDSSAMTVKN